MACNLCILNAVVTNFLIQGGRYYNKPVTAEAIVSLGPQLYITSTQVIQTIKMLTPYFIMQGEDLLRASLRCVSEHRKQASNSVSCCYAYDDSIRFLKTGMSYGQGGSRHDDRGEAPGEHGASSRMFGNQTEAIDWNYQKFQLSVTELMNYVRMQEGSDRATEHMLSMTINDLCQRNILARPYVRKPMACDTDDPVPAEPNSFDSCPCTVGQGGEHCKDHSPREIPIIKRHKNSFSEVLLVSTEWLMKSKSDSAVTVIDDALYDFFNHRYQPSIKCTAGYSEEHCGTFDVFEIVAPAPEDDQRPVFTVPNMHKLTEQEHRFIHERGMADDLDQPEITDEDFEREFYTADTFILKQRFDDYAALARRTLQYPCNEKITLRDLAKVLYSVGEKLGWVDDESPLCSVKYDPEDPHFLRYDDTEDLDVPTEDFMVPSEKDPKVTVDIRDELDLTLSDFKMVMSTPDYLETRQDIYETRVNQNTLVGKYPDDLRASLISQERNRLTVSLDDALISGHRTMPLTKQLNTSDADIQKLMDSHAVIGKKRSDLRAKLIEKMFVKSQMTQTYTDAACYSVDHIQASPSNYSPKSRVNVHESPHRDAFDPTNLADMLRMSLVVDVRDAVGNSD